MPLVRITYPRGALNPSQKRRIASDLTEVVLDAEVDAVTDAGRMVTVIQFQEVGADDWAVAGELRSTAAGAPNHFIVDVIVLQGLLEGARRTDVHRRVTDLIVESLGEGGDPMQVLRVWVLIHEVREGSWGAGGHTVGALDVASFISAEVPAARRAEIGAAVARG